MDRDEPSASPLCRDVSSPIGEQVHSGRALKALLGRQCPPGEVTLPRRSQYLVVPSLQLSLVMPQRSIKA